LVCIFGGSTNGGEIARAYVEIHRRGSLDSVLHHFVFASFEIFRNGLIGGNMKVQITFEAHDDWCDPGSPNLDVSQNAATLALSIKDLVVNTSEFKHITVTDWKEVKDYMHKPKRS
jgi:hypothetical protein